MLLELVLVVSIGFNALTILVLANQRRKGNQVMTQNADALNSLAIDVQSESSVVDAAIVLVHGLVNRLTEILSQTNTPEDLTSQIQALRDEINTRAVALGQAVAEGTAAEDDSSNFPTSPTSSDTSGQSTGTTSSDSSAGAATSGDAGQITGSDATPPADTSAESGQPQSPAGDGTGDVAPPSTADLPPTEDSPPPVETPGDEAVVPDTGSAVPDEATTSDSPPQSE